MNSGFTHRIESFEKLGYILKDAGNNSLIEDAIPKQAVENPWFTPTFIRYALTSIADMLSKDNLSRIMESYGTLIDNAPEKNLRIAVVSAGNIPLAAFHDFFSILITGNTYVGKLSSHDKIMLPAIAKILTEIDPSLHERIIFTERLSSFDKIIATGSNNSSRYFEYYFGKYPHILRKNRNSVAILSGNESEEDLAKLFLDIFLYFGLGCRSVSMLFVPERYDFSTLIRIINDQGGEVAMHHPYLNNLDFQKTMHLMNQIPYIDGGIALFIEKKQLSSPISMIHYSSYKTLDEVSLFLQEEQNNLQCIVSQEQGIQGLPFGTAQKPTLLDFPDNIDIIRWIMS